LAGGETSLKTGGGLGGGYCKTFVKLVARREEKERGGLGRGGGTKKGRWGQLRCVKLPHIVTHLHARN